MAIWGKRKTTKKEELQHTQADDIIQIQKSFGRVALACEQYDGITKGVLQSSDQVRHGVKVLAEGAARQREAWLHAILRMARAVNVIVMRSEM